MRQYFPYSIPQDVIDVVVKDYYSRIEYETTSMNKADPGESLSLLLPFCIKAVGHEIEFKSGNFYRHSVPYFPHTDFRVDQGNDINIVIPLAYTGDQASLVIFDQAWYRDSVTWCLDREVIYFSVNTGVAGRPYDYADVVGKTDQDIDQEFYEKYLSHHNRSCFFGLSGVAFPFQPTGMIMFDNRLIHCTSKFSGEKLGLTLRFRKK